MSSKRRGKTGRSKHSARKWTPDTPIDTLGEVTLHHGENTWTMVCDAVAVAKDHAVKVLSVSGPGTTAKAWASALRARNGWRPMYLSKMDIGMAIGSGTYFTYDQHGYSVRTAQLDKDTWHVMAVSKDPRLIIGNPTDSLYAMIMSDRYSCPMLREWVPYIKERAEQGNLIVALGGIGCAASLFTALNETLERMVHEGLKSGKITIK